MEKISRSAGSALYRLSPLPHTECYIFTTPESRSICNDPLVYGVTYTNALKHAVTKALQLFGDADIAIGEESHALILHILRGGLNFGIRDALFDVYGWSSTTSAFISSQRVFKNLEGWQISENSYRKMPGVDEADVIFGDVVATGVSLRHAIQKLITEAREAGATYRSLTFFTIGAVESERIIADAAALCAELFPNFKGARVVYLEGIFGVPDAHSPLSISMPGTDLLRSPAELAPEFIASQKDSLSYALERCVIYDAGSRAFEPHTYLADVEDYWKRVAALGNTGTSVFDYLKERFPADERLSDAAFERTYASPDSLAKLAEERVALLRKSL
ncbi:hypothetical protein A2763_01185 [Candidatus Kaiserbacteria bacterium RIFCSPHIGHO2_01_FULL_54_36]|uniref:Uncharacterized protein n=1 Tax=Candidatus Kaiserbacteria bacterium RIFCSPHIGHO2_01_FULL_54_36 TaxID=1798482 RepID=A0A1F6CQK7_9BACT|nr:MAG: hypothetical protein A2763_01185 [Candidatus Kaiserbacteria bacterium RIFCSPHIGHO2_01_FULL_54_36]OGG75964.1 MAG: hypothetical protein A3A41_00975 [Candidatus Kaiserbacteria bacterium RIFCSPLOWO2_01_FULL_54_22]